MAVGVGYKTCKTEMAEDTAIVTINCPYKVRHEVLEYMTLNDL